MVRFAYLDLATVEATIGEDDAAIAHLRRAVELGFQRYDPATRAEFAHLVGSPDFDGKRVMDSLG